MCLLSEAQQEFRCYCENRGMNTDYVDEERIDACSLSSIGIK